MIFSARQVQEKCREHGRDLCLALLDLTNAFDSVNREALWACLARLVFCRLVYICIHFCYTLGNHDYFLRNTYLSGKNVVAIFSVWSRGHFQHKMYKNMNITRKN